MIHTAVADIIGPTVTADDPDGFFHQVIGHMIQPFGRAFFTFQGCLQFNDTSTLGFDFTLGNLRCSQDGISQFLGNQAILDSSIQQFNSLACQFVNRLTHTQTMLGVVLEQGVGPSRSPAICTLAVRGGRQVAGVDRSTTGGIGGQHPVANHLGYQFDVRGLAATGTSAGELKQRTFELAALDGPDVDQAFINFRQRQEGLPVISLTQTQFFGVRLHGQGAVLGFFAVLVFGAARANADTQGTTATIGGGHLDGELHILELFAHGIGGFKVGRRTGSLESTGGGNFHPDTAVRTNQ